MRYKYAAIENNDYINGEGICVSFWVQGCPHRCEGCHNPEAWDFEGGQDLPYNYKGKIIQAIGANGIHRNFSILGGEPLCPENMHLVCGIVNCVRAAYPNIRIFLWTGYNLEDIIEHPTIKEILEKIDVLIDGPFIQDQRDISLKMRGSKNQRLLYRGVDF